MSRGETFKKCGQYSLRRECSSFCSDFNARRQNRRMKTILHDRYSRCFKLNINIYTHTHTHYTPACFSQYIRVEIYMILLYNHYKDPADVVVLKKKMWKISKIIFTWISIFISSPFPLTCT